MNQVLLVILGGVIAAIAGVISQTIAQRHHRKNRRSEVLREKAEQLARALIDIKHATERISTSGDKRRVDQALLDQTSVGNVELLTGLYFPDMDVTQFFLASRIFIEASKQLERSEPGDASDDAWPIFTSSAMSFDHEAEQLLARLSEVVHAELGKKSVKR